MEVTGSCIDFIGVVGERSAFLNPGSPQTQRPLRGRLYPLWGYIQSCVSSIAFRIDPLKSPFSVLQIL